MLQPTPIVIRYIFNLTPIPIPMIGIGIVLVDILLGDKSNVVLDKQNFNVIGDSNNMPITSERYIGLISV